MVTRLSFAGTTSGIGGRVLPRKVACSVTILLQGNRDLPYSVTGTFGVHRMDLVNDYPYFFLRQRLDHLKTDGICSLQHLEALYVSVTRALGQLLMYFEWV